MPYPKQNHPIRLNDAGREVIDWACEALIARADQRGSERGRGRGGARQACGAKYVARVKRNYNGSPHWKRLCPEHYYLLRLKPYRAKRRKKKRAEVRAIVAVARSRVEAAPIVSAAPARASSPQGHLPPAAVVDVAAVAAEVAAVVASRVVPDLLAALRATLESLVRSTSVVCPNCTIRMYPSEFAGKVIASEVERVRTEFRKGRTIAEVLKHDDDGNGKNAAR